MSRPRNAFAVVAGLACFALGLGVARVVGTAAPPRPPAVEPRIVFDPASIELLPDASLHLDLPRGFDAGAP